VAEVDAIVAHTQKQTPRWGGVSASADGAVEAS
jgi:hypothetical protein